MTERSPFNSSSDGAPDSNDNGSQSFACRLRMNDLATQSDSDRVEVDVPVKQLRLERDVSNWPTHPEIIELIASLLDSSPNLKPGKEASECDRPHSVYLPEHYEAGYAYPLVVWFHREGASEAELHRVMPQISDRNYIGVALRGGIKLKKGFDWNLDEQGINELVGDVQALAISMRRKYHIHSERIYLAGFGTGATAAINVMLKQPEWFGGVLSLNGDFPKLNGSIEQLGELKDKRVLLATSVDCMKTKLGDVVAAGRLLYAAGMQVGTRVYQDANRGPTKKMLRDIDSWLMDDICSATSELSI